MHKPLFPRALPGRCAQACAAPAVGRSLPFPSGACAGCAATPWPVRLRRDGPGAVEGPAVHWCIGGCVGALGGTGAGVPHPGASSPAGAPPLAGAGRPGAGHAPPAHLPPSSSGHRPPGVRPCAGAGRSAGEREGRMRRAFERAYMQVGQWSPLRQGLRSVCLFPSSGVCAYWRSSPRRSATGRSSLHAHSFPSCLLVLIRLRTRRWVRPCAVAGCELYSTGAAHAGGVGSCSCSRWWWPVPMRSTPWTCLCSTVLQRNRWSVSARW